MSHRLCLLLLACLVVPSVPEAAPITRVVAFGDSLSDGGNAFALSGGAYPPSPPNVRRATNGPTAVEQLATNLGLTLTPSSVGGSNYAIVGAATGQVAIPGAGGATTNNFVTTFGQPFSPVFAGKGIDAQVGQFIGAGSSFDPTTTLFFLWGGNNDFLINQSGAVAGQVITNLTNQVLALYNVGARRIVVPNSPDLSKTPFALGLPPADQFALLQLSLGFNAALAQSMNQLSLLPGIQLTQFNVFDLLNAVIANPAAFGFTDVTSPCLNQATFTPCAQPAQYLFWDTGHPTAAAHALLGQRLAEQVVPEPSTVALLLTGLAAGVERARRIARRRAA